MGKKIKNLNPSSDLCYLQLLPFCFFFALDDFIYGVCVHLYLLHLHPLFLDLFDLTTFFTFQYNNAICRTRFRSNASKNTAFVITLARCSCCCCCFFLLFRQIYSIFFYCTNAHTLTYRILWCTFEVEFTVLLTHSSMFPVYFSLL